MLAPAGFTQTLPPDNEVWRVHTTTDVGNVRTRGFRITKCYPLMVRSLARICIIGFFLGGGGCPNSQTDPHDALIILRYKGRGGGGVAQGLLHMGNFVYQIGHKMNHTQSANFS